MDILSNPLLFSYSVKEMSVEGGSHLRPVRFRQAKECMTLSKKISEFKQKIKDSFIQECPPELYACERCGKPECSSAEWIECQRRQKSAEYMESLKDQSSDSDCSFLSVNESFDEKS